MLELKLPPVIVVMLFAMTMMIATAWLPSLTYTIPYKPVIIGLIWVLGGGFAIAGVVSFTHANTTLNPTSPEKASQLVSSGIYRVTRNPMYLGMLVLLLGFGLFLGNLIAPLIACGFFPYMNRFQIRPEEKILKDVFGEDFTHYRDSVRRWC